MSESKIRVLLADDHTLVRQGFRVLIEDDPRLVVVGEARTGLEAMKQAAAVKCDVVVMDISMPDIGGLEAAAEILKRDPDVRIVILSMHSSPAYVRKAIDVGARGYVLKDAIDAELVQAIVAVARGDAFFSPAVSRFVLQSLKEGNPPQAEPDRYDQLTLREKEVLQLIAEGKSNKEIASLLEISVNTVAVHRSHLMETLGLHRTAELVLYAVKRGLIETQ
jgi:two-component system response regulator NreC